MSRTADFHFSGRTYRALTLPCYKSLVRTIEEFGFQATAAWKRLISIFKTEWRIEDYPIHVRFHSLAETPQASRLKPFPWTATVINWPGMLGGGETRQEALEDLRKKFEHFKATNEVWPRPGVKVPVKFAASTRIERHAELADDFVKRVLGIEWAWISDESSLGDFHDEETNEVLIQKIRTTYGVDVSDISSGNLADIFDRIAEK